MTTTNERLDQLLAELRIDEIDIRPEGLLLRLAENAVTSNDRAVLEEIAARFTLLRIDAESLRRQVDTWAKMAARILESDVQSNVHSRILELVSRLRTERDEHKELGDRHRRAMDQQRQEIAQLQRDLADVRAKPVRKTTRPKVAAS